MLMVRMPPTSCWPLFVFVMLWRGGTFERWSSHEGLTLSNVPLSFSRELSLFLSCEPTCLFPLYDTTGGPSADGDSQILYFPVPRTMNQINFYKRFIHFILCVLCLHVCICTSVRPCCPWRVGAMPAIAKEHSIGPESHHKVSPSKTSSFKRQSWHLYCGKDITDAISIKDHEMWRLPEIAQMNPVKSCEFLSDRIIAHENFPTLSCHSGFEDRQMWQESRNMTLRLRMTLSL